MFFKLSTIEKEKLLTIPSKRAKVSEFWVKYLK